MADYIDSREAAHRLGVTRQTLYAYVSRGLLRAYESDVPRERRYRSDEVEQLAQRKARGRRPKDAAQAVLDWGLPVMESGITLIQNGKLYYRGHDAVALADTMSVEDVAALLWAFPAEQAFSPEAPATPAAFDQMIPLYAGMGPEEALMPLFAVAGADDLGAPWQKDAARRAGGCGSLVRILCACLLQASCSNSPIHTQVAAHWGLDDAGADLVRRVLVLCADHELNASSFTARCVASTGASLRAVVLAGLAALSGGRHGGLTARVESLWDEIEAADNPQQALQRRLTRDEALPGFGHPLYPDGDPRAPALLARLLGLDPMLGEIVSAAEEMVGLRPTIDVALVAVRRHLNLPEGAAFGLFALGRSVGWIAHALEQREADQLIRPRALYTGPQPEA